MSIAIHHTWDSVADIQELPPLEDLSDTEPAAAPSVGFAPPWDGWANALAKGSGKKGKQTNSSRSRDRSGPAAVPASAPWPPLSQIPRSSFNSPVPTRPAPASPLLGSSGSQGEQVVAASAVERELDEEISAAWGTVPLPGPSTPQPAPKTHEQADDPLLLPQPGFALPGPAAPGFATAPFPSSGTGGARAPRPSRPSGGGAAVPRLPSTPVGNLLPSAADNKKNTRTPEGCG